MSSNEPRRRLSVIIPAAGANTRLEGHVAPYLKPTILVNGLSLIQHAVNYAQQEWASVDYSITIVASPHNAMILPPLVREHVTKWVLQPNPDGIVDAIRRGFDPMSDWTGILCADNIYNNGKDGVGPTVRSSGVPQFGSRYIPGIGSNRFTTWSQTEGFFAKGALSLRTDPHVCWVGPLLIPTNYLSLALKAGGASIETVLNHIHQRQPFEQVKMLCSDMGIPEEL